MLTYLNIMGRNKVVSPSEGVGAEYVIFMGSHAREPFVFLEYPVTLG